MRSSFSERFREEHNVTFRPYNSTKSLMTASHTVSTCTLAFGSAVGVPVSAVIAACNVVCGATVVAVVDSEVGTDYSHAAEEHFIEFYYPLATSQDGSVCYRETWLVGVVFFRCWGGVNGCKRLKKDKNEHCNETKQQGAPSVGAHEEGSTFRESTALEEGEETQHGGKKQQFGGNGD